MALMLRAGFDASLASAGVSGGILGSPRLTINGLSFTNLSGVTAHIDLKYFDDIGDLTSGVSIAGIVLPNNASHTFFLPDGFIAPEIPNDPAATKRNGYNIRVIAGGLNMLAHYYFR